MTVFFKKLASALLEYLLLLPILLFVTMFAFEEPFSFWALGVVVLALPLGLLICTLIPRRPLWQYITGVTLWLLLSLATSVLGAPGSGVSFVAILGLLLFYRARMHYESAWPDIFPSFYAFYLSFAVFVIFIVVGIAPRYAPYRLLFTVVGFISIVANLLVMRHLNLRLLTRPGGAGKSRAQLAVSRGLGTQSLVLLGILFIIILLASTWRQLMDAAAGAVLLLWDGIMYLIGLMIPGGESTQGGGGGDMLGGLSELGTSTPNPLWEQIERIITYAVAILAIVAFAAFLVFLLYRLIRVLVRWLRGLMQQRGMLREGFDAYTDRYESLLSLRDLPRRYAEMAADWVADLLRREPDWNTLRTGREKARALYRRVLLRAISRGYGHRPSDTPAQALHSAAKPLGADAESLESLRIAYELARYSEEQPDPDDMDRLRKQLQIR